MNMDNLNNYEKVEMVGLESNKLKSRANRGELELTHDRTYDAKTYGQKSEEVNDLLIDAISAKLAILENIS